MLHSEWTDDPSVRPSESSPDTPRPREPQSSLAGAAPHAPLPLDLRGRYVRPVAARPRTWLRPGSCFSCSSVVKEQNTSPDLVVQGTGPTSITLVVDALQLHSTRPGEGRRSRSGGGGAPCCRLCGPALWAGRRRRGSHSLWTASVPARRQGLRRRDLQVGARSGSLPMAVAWERGRGWGPRRGIFGEARWADRRDGGSG